MEDISTPTNPPGQGLVRQLKALLEAQRAKPNSMSLSLPPQVRRDALEAFTSLASHAFGDSITFVDRDANLSVDNDETANETEGGVQEMQLGFHQRVSQMERRQSRIRSLIATTNKAVMQHNI